MQIKPLLLLAAALLMGAAGMVRAAESLESMFERTSPAVAALYAQENNGSLRFLCSTTAAEKTEHRTLLVTAYHCVEKDVSYLVSFDGKQFYAARVWSVPRWEVDPQKYRKAFGTPDVDLAFFAVDEPLNVSVLRFGSDTNVAPGRPIVTVGFPLGVTKVRYSGIVSGRLERPGSGLDGYLTLQIFGSPGSSGSSVIDQTTGEIIGILVAAHQAFVGLPVIFATPANYKSYLMRVNPVADKP
ncbi:MAG: serine protease [Deltaproteobacteria bacterium]|nr:serine protease [Deltaproteobacteria bacterium]